MRTVQTSALCRSRRELANAYFVAKFGFDTEENEACKVCPLSAYRSPRYRHRRCSVWGILISKHSKSYQNSQRTDAGGGPRCRGFRRRALHQGRLTGCDVSGFGKIRQNFARFRLYQNEILQVNMRLTAFFKIYQTI